MNKIYSKNFLKSLFFKQNGYHANGVLLHTFYVTYQLIKHKHYKMAAAGLFHDIGKMYVAKADALDIAEGKGNLSFTNHEEISYQIVKNWWFLSDYTKQIIRYHYIIRSMKKSKKRGLLSKHKRLKKSWDKLPESMKQDLGNFLKCDDLGKAPIFFKK